jgi:CheY-like chemotaxis protein
MEPINSFSQLRVLAVDDDADTRETIALLDRLQGHDACTARDGPSALAVAASYRPDVILLDVAMPGMNGWVVARSLRGNPATRHAYIVGVTGYVRDVDRQRSLEAGSMITGPSRSRVTNSDTCWSPSVPVGETLPTSTREGRRISNADAPKLKGGSGIRRRPSDWQVRNSRKHFTQR